MTLAQWVFHYNEIIFNRKQERDWQVDFAKEVLDVLSSNFELVGAMANPAAGKMLSEIKKLKQYRQELTEDDMNDILSKVPQTLKAKGKPDDAGKKFILPKMEREKKPFLSIDED